MELQDKVKILQATYAGALADSVLRLGREGVLEKVTEAKRAEQMAGGALRARQMGVASVEGIFETLSDIFGCANWTVEKDPAGNELKATATRCMLCAIAKKMDAPQPCSIYCLDPMEGMAKGLDPSIQFNTESTLWDCERCSVKISKTKNKE
jgi:hypothetical protein